MLSNTIKLAASGNPGTSYWIATLGGAGEDIGNDIVVDSSNNIYIVGYTNSQGSGLDDIFLAKYDSNGVLQWQRRLGGTGTELASYMAIDSSNNIYITGYTTSQGSGLNDLVIVKYNSSGTLQWQKRLGGTGDEWGRRITVDSSGNVYVVGQTDSQGAGTTDILLVKYSSAGLLLWQRSLGGTGGEIGYGVVVVGTDVYISGQTASQGQGASDCLVAKYDSTGAIQWQRSLGGSLADQSWGMSADSSSTYIIGYTLSVGAGGTDLLLAKFNNTNGTTQWQKVLGAAGDEYGRNVAYSSGNVYAVGQTSQGGGVSNALIAKYDSGGTLQWQRRLGGAGTELARSVAIDNSGSLCIVGTTTTQGGGGTNVLLAKLPSDGSLTGTYEGFTYTGTALTDASVFLTSGARTLTAATTTLTAANATLTEAAATLTSATIPI